MSRNNCPACNRKLNFDKYKINGFIIKKCKICNTLFVNNLPSVNNLKIYTFQMITIVYQLNQRIE